MLASTTLPQARESMFSSTSWVRMTGLYVSFDGVAMRQGHHQRRRSQQDSKHIVSPLLFPFLFTAFYQVSRGGRALNGGVCGRWGRRRMGQAVRWLARGETCIGHKFKFYPFLKGNFYYTSAAGFARVFSHVCVLFRLESAAGCSLLLPSRGYEHNANDEA